MIVQPFKMPDFTRHSWVSDKAENLWKPRVEAIGVVWRKLGHLSVAHGLRQCALANVSSDKLADFSGECVELGLTVLPLSTSSVGRYGFSNKDIAPKTGDAFVYRCVVGKPANIVKFRVAWMAQDHLKIGNLLGYPKCCTSFFHNLWAVQGKNDTLWPMVANHFDDESGVSALQVENVFQTNVFMRFIGVRLVQHLPCGIDCKHSIRSGDRYLELGNSLSHGKEMEWAKEILSWPTKWSSKNGISITHTPVMKIIASTDFSTELREISLMSDRNPEESARGIAFPFRTGRANKIKIST